MVKRVSRNWLAAAVVILASVLAGVFVLRTTRAANVGSPFADTSFWDTPIPANAPLHEKSAIYAQNIKDQVSKYYGTATVNTTRYAAPIYIVDSNVPTTAVKFNDCQKKGYFDQSLKEQWSAVPIPSYAQQSDGTDGEMVVYQPSTDTVWEFWQTQKREDGWYACWGGRLKGVSTSDGIFPRPYGTTATGLSFMGGQMTVAELQAGEIRHAIGVALVEVKRGTQSWPANRNDGWVDHPDAIPEGLRFRLDPTLDVDSLNLHPVAKTMAKAMQKYGMVVWDKAGAVSFRADNPKAITSRGGTDPYPAIFKGTPNYRILDNFPWDRLQALPFDYGKPGTASPPPSPPPAPAKRGDLNGDGKVNSSDLSVLLSKWGTSDAKADVNGSGRVDAADLSALLGSWG